MDTTFPTVGFVGMTHLGINSAAAAAARGFSVVCFDPDPNLIADLAKANPRISEPQLAVTLAAHVERMSFSCDPSALTQCDLVYIASDVPTDDQGKSDLQPIRNMASVAWASLRPDALLIVLSQVPPGFTRSLALPGKQLFYQVETLIFGRAVERALHPERFILGCARPEDPLPRALATFLDAFSCPVLPMRYESAELAKISINFFLVSSVSTSNTLAEIAAHVGADWCEIIPALRLDKRIGAHAYLAPGLGIAGGNLERDLRTALEIGSSFGTHTEVIEAWLDNSRYCKGWLWRTLLREVLAESPDARIAVLGLAYKENTHSTKNSAAIELLEHLRAHTVSVHDPVVSASVVPWAHAATDPLDCARGADVLVLATPWPEYRSLEPSTLARVMRGRIVLDPYRLLDKKVAAGEGFSFHVLGRRE